MILSVLMSYRNSCIGINTHSVFKQGLANISSLTCTGRACEQATSDMCRILIERIEFGHILKQADKAGAWIALEGDKEQACIIEHPLPPGWSAFCGKAHTFIIIVTPSENPDSTIRLR